MQHSNVRGLEGSASPAAEPRPRPRVPCLKDPTIRARIMRPHKKLRPEDDDVRAWVIIGLIFCAVALAVWIPVVVERHFIQQ
jgi:hypothetical protein